MSIEEQIAALEARIQQTIIMADGCTERAESAASRAEEAAMRAELAAGQSQQAELVASLAATTATTSAAIAVEQEEEIEEIIEETAENQIEETAENQIEETAGEGIEDVESNEQTGSDGEREARPEVGDMERKREAETGQSEPITIRIEATQPKSTSFFSSKRTTFRRGRTH